MLPFINPSLIAFTISAASGVLVHDTHIDRMATVAIGVPVIVMHYAVDDILKKSDHTHVERAAFQKNASTPSRSALPKTQPRDEDRKYIQNKKASLNGGDSHYTLWPSV